MSTLNACCGPRVTDTAWTAAWVEVSKARGIRCGAAVPSTTSSWTGAACWCSAEFSRGESLLPRVRVRRRGAALGE